MKKIQEAKDLLWESVINVHHGDRSDLRCIKRKKTGTTGTCSKETADCKDILKALQVCDREGTAMPKFCAIDLGNIPPAGLDNMDISILGQISQLHAEMGSLKKAVNSLQESSDRVYAESLNKPAPPQWATVASMPPKCHQTAPHVQHTQPQALNLDTQERAQQQRLQEEQKLKHQQQQQLQQQKNGGSHHSSTEAATGCGQ